MIQIVAASKCFEMLIKTLMTFAIFFNDFYCIGANRVSIGRGLNDEINNNPKSHSNLRTKEKKILDEIIGDGRYDNRIRPSGFNYSVDGSDDGNDGPCFVVVNIFLRSISKISDLDMEYSVQITFREEWRDERLQYNDNNEQIKFLTLTDPNRIWKPDLFFSNEKEGHFHTIIMPNVLLRIYPDGSVLYSIRISLLLACPMDLKYYPLDEQECYMRMASYGYTTDDLVFRWKDGDPVQITSNLHLPRFALQKVKTAYCTSRTNTGEYSCLKVFLDFKREFSYYLIQIYMPCCMLVIVSWVSFWLDPNAIPARVSLGVTTLLTMATQISGINASLPPVSYIKAIDVWTGVCLAFVFGALLEFALVNYASRSDAHRAAREFNGMRYQRRWDKDGNVISDETSYALRPLVIKGNEYSNKNIFSRWWSKFPTRSKRIDVVSRIFFPLMFCLFNVVYWVTYLFRHKKDKSVS
ncbi:glutamate-gated chloride channel-like [Panonychus citri]|uniref:glutamate-gated chloride channel-like n=1 Tax=Panonychus citri TaxID=50023 RepID=UPI002307C256|nr:glutamate-gated chloride channel-like [Panonychus citri]